MRILILLAAAAVIAVSLALMHETQPPTRLLAPPQGFRSVHGRDGFWRIVETTDHTWWFLSPQGHLEFLNTVTTVQPYQQAGDPRKPGFVSTDWHGDIDAWAKTTVRRVGTTYGFKGIGAWSSDALIGYGMPVSRCLYLLDWLPKNDDARRFYSPGWETGLEAAVRQQVVPLKDAVDLVGYFTDNERNWSESNIGPSCYFDHRSPEDPNRCEVVKVMQQLWQSPAAFSRDWHVQLQTWSELSHWQELPRQPAQAYGRLLDAWTQHVCQRYFSVTTRLIRKYDPNHLILGVRFQGHPPIEVVGAARGFTDAVSINIYNNDGSLDLPRFTQMAQAAQQPIIVSEFSYHSLDNHSGNRNLCGFTARVPDQKARADLYVLFTTRLVNTPFVIGADWFQWNDEPPSGRGDGEDADFGIVDIFDHPYQLLVASIRQITPQLNALHERSAAHFDFPGVQQ